MRLLAVVVLLIIAALAAGIYFSFNPAIPIFVILGFGMYWLTRSGGPPLPEGTHIWGDTYGVYLEGRDVPPPDASSHSGGELRDGVYPDDPAGTRGRRDGP